MKSSPAAQTLWTLVKFALPLGIIGWLVATLEPAQLQQLGQRPIHWPLMGLGFALLLGAVCLTFVRWFLLVRALHLPFRLRDAFRLGFLAYLLNFVSVGSVGGDLFKAFFIAREQPGRRTEAVATVVVDRMVGLYALLIVTSMAILLSEAASQSAEVAGICQATLVLTAIGGAGILMVLRPGFTTGSVSEMLVRIPRLGSQLERLIQAVRMYRSRPGVLMVIGLLSVTVHSLLAVAIFAFAQSLFVETPALAEHFVIVPLAMVAGALPFTPGGLGAFELALDKLYVWIPAQETLASGVLVALAYRVATIAVATIGIVVYWARRRTVDQIYREAEMEAEKLREQGGEQPLTQINESGKAIRPQSPHRAEPENFSKPY